MEEEEKSRSEEEQGGGGEYLLGCLSDSGVKIPNDVTSIKNLTPQSLLSISAQSLSLLLLLLPPNHHLTYYTNNNNYNNNNNMIEINSSQTSSSVADRYNISSQLASQVTSLGFHATFHNFLYPSEEDYNKLIRFFVMKLSELPPQQLQKKSSDKRVNSDHGSSDHLIDESATPLQDVKTNLDRQESTKTRSHYSSSQEGLENLETLKEVEKKIEDVLSKTKKREQELCILLATLENQPKVGPSRRSYIQRISEITKNSRKQDADIESILKDTRELQLESNYIRERLNRTYAVVDETLSREGKKDLVGRQAYQLLTSIHEGFEQISDKILTTDRLRREAVEFEAKLSVLSRRSFNVEKLQGDLDAIRRENEFLERHLGNDDNSRILWSNANTP